MAGALLLAGCDSNQVPEISIVSTSNGIPQVKVTTSQDKLEARAKEMAAGMQREFELLTSVKLPAIQTKGRELSEVISQINRDIDGTCPDGMSIKLALIHRDLPSERAKIIIDSDLPAGTVLQRTNNLQALASRITSPDSVPFVAYEITYAP